MTWQRERRILSGFLLVGSLGFAVDAGLLTWLVRVGWDPYAARLCSFPVAVLVTFALNRRYTYQAEASGGIVAQFLAYLGGQLGGVVINLMVYAGLLLQVAAWAETPWIALACASLAAMAFTYLTNKLIFGRAHH